MYRTLSDIPGSGLLCDRYYKPAEHALLYEQILSGLEQMEPRIPCPDTSAETLRDVLHRILLDHPHLCHFEGRWRFDRGVLPIYTLSYPHRAALEHAVTATAESLRASCSGEEALARAAYLWLARNVRYDPFAPHSQSAYGALVERQAVCKGIAKAYQLLLRKLDIPCILVEGSLDGVGKHVWNLCFLHGQWRHSDVTMYYPQFASRRRTGDPMDYFSVTADDILSTHTILHPDQLPAAQQHYFHSLNKTASHPQRTSDLLPPRLRSMCTEPLHHIDSGSAGDVYSTFYRGKPAVVKQIRCGLDMNRMYHAMRECSMTQLVQTCPGTVRLLEQDISRTPEGFTVFLVMEKLTSLDEYCLRYGLTVRSAVQLTLDLCTALQQCWDAGVAHLDVQPANIFVNSAGQAVLGDFGSALPVEELNTLRHRRGTPAYMAPEVRQDYLYSQASEICSLGIVLYSMLCGGGVPFAEGLSLKEATHRRFAGEPVHPPRHFHPVLCSLVEKACAHDPRRRYETLDSLRQALQLVLPHCHDTPIFPVRPLAGTAPDSGATQSFLCYPHTEPLRWEDQYGVSRLNPETSCKAPDPAGRDSLPPEGFTGASMDFGSTACGTTFPTVCLDADEYATSVALAFDGYGSTSALEAPGASAPEPVPVRADQVQFSAVSPQTATKGEYTIVQLYMYEQAYRCAVDEALEMGEGPMQEKKTGFYQAARNTLVKVVLSSTDVDIPDGTLEQVWSGGYLCFDFALEIPFSYMKPQVLLKAAVYFDGIPVTRLLLTMKARSLRDQKLELSRSDVLTAFVSYASQDRSRVGALVQGMRKARPDMDIFFDVSSLRSGENWEAALRAEIEKRDTLFLCWSNNARQSPWVDREWRYALARKGPDAIEPIPIDPPDICPPPEELKSKHFNDQMLYIINR